MTIRQKIRKFTDSFKKRAGIFPFLQPAEDIDAFIKDLDQMADTMQYATELPSEAFGEPLAKPKKPAAPVLLAAPDPIHVPAILSGEAIPGLKLVKYRRPVFRCVEYGGLRGSFPKAEGNVTIAFDKVNLPTKKRVQHAFHSGVTADRGKRALRHTQMFFAAAGLPLLTLLHPIEPKPAQVQGHGAGLAAQMSQQQAAINQAMGQQLAGAGQASGGGSTMQMGAVVGAPPMFGSGIASTQPKRVAGHVVGGIDIRDEFYPLLYKFQAGAFMHAVKITIEGKKSRHLNRVLNGMFDWSIFLAPEKYEAVVYLWCAMVLEPLGWSPDMQIPEKVVWPLGELE